jgi:rhomboid protease GluP
LRSQGMMDGAALSRGEWWRPFTATWLHADAGHLAANLGFGVLFLGLVMGRFGPGIGLLAAYLAGIGGNLAAWLVYGANHRGLGASGVVMGALGLLAVPSLALLRQGKAGAFRLVAGGLLSGLMLFVLFGMNPETDVVAHFGGFVTGIVLGLPLVLIQPLTQRWKLNLAAGILFGSLVVWPWLRALK